MWLPQVGEVFEGRFQIVSQLGQGGFATVFSARDRQSDETVVIKVLSPTESGYSASVRARFFNEANIFSTLSHPNIIRILGFGQADAGLLYMVFEYVKARELTDFISGQPLPPHVATRILEQLLSALEAAHALGVLHRDLKPANILVHESPSGPHTVKLIDFGIAKDLSPNAPKITKTGRIVGTVRYMSPEQIFGEPLTPRSDLFSLGLVAYEMLTGRPLLGGSQREVLPQLTGGSALGLPPGVGTPELRDVIDKMLAKQPDQRFAGASSALLALKQQPPSRAEPAGSASARREMRGIVLLAAVFGVGFAAVLAFMLGMFEPERSGSTPEPSVRRDSTRLSGLVVGTESGPRDDPETSQADMEQVADASATEPDAAVEEARGEFRDIGGAPVYWPHSYESGSRIVGVYGDKHVDWGHFVESSGWRSLADQHGVVLFGSGTNSIFSEHDQRQETIERLELVREATKATELYVVLYGTGWRMVKTMFRQEGVDGIVGHSAYWQDGEFTNRTKVRRIPLLMILPRESIAYPLAPNPCRWRVRPIEEFEDMWADRMGCEDEATITRDGEVECHRWTCEVPFESCRVPGGSRWPGTGTYSEDDCVPFMFRHITEYEAEFPSTPKAWDFIESLSAVAPKR